MRRALPSGGLPNQHEAPSLLGAPTYPASVWETAKANTFGFERIRQGLARGASAARGFSWESGRQDPAGDSFSDRLSRQSSRAIENGTTALRSAVVHVDDYLSRQHGVRPFTTDKRCVLRFAIIRSPAPIRLSDGVSIECGAAVVDLHLWSEHIPLAPKGGPNLAWALQVTDQLKQSLRELARAVARVPEMRDARAFRAQTNFVGRGCSGESLSRIIKRYGFEDVDEGLPSFPARVHDLFENVLIGALVWTHNPEALRRDKLIRERRPVWISRAKLLRLHGGS